MSTYNAPCNDALTLIKISAETAAKVAYE
jgi:hypothetical protein